MKRKSIALISVPCAIVALVVWILTTAAPSGGSAKESDLVGTWHGRQGAELTLRADGTLATANFPTSFASDDETPVEFFTGNGTWTLEKKDGGEDQDIKLSLGETAGSKQGAWLRVAGKDAGGGMYVPISVDRPKKFVFSKPS